MLSQMAATAGSVAVGSTIGHALSSMLFGGGSTTAPEAQAPPAPVEQMARQQTGGISCEVQAKGINFKCVKYHPTYPVFSPARLHIVS